MSWFNIFLIVFIFSQIWIIIGITNAPTMPDDYGLSDEEYKIYKKAKDEENTKIT